MEMKNQIKFLFLRYFSLLILGLGNLFLFYFIFTPLTIYPSFLIMDIFYEASLFQNTIIFSGYEANIIPACIAGSAYYLLLILNLATPMSPLKRIKSISFLLGLFLVINIARIVLFASIFASKYEIFDIAHSASWYFGSTILVILLWFSNVYLFNIKSIPIYTDIKSIINQIKGKK